MANEGNKNQHLIMRGVTGKLEWIKHVGEVEGKPLYQASHFWMYGKRKKKTLRNGEVFVVNDR